MLGLTRARALQMSSLRTWAGRLGILAVILLSPIFGSLMLIAAEILIDLLMEAGAIGVYAIAGGAVGWVLFRRMSPHPERVPMSDEAAIAAPPG
jgi:hypothetical protein